MVSSVIISVSKPLTSALVAKVLRQRFSSSLTSLPSIHSPPSCLDFASSLATLLEKSYESQEEWEERKREEGEENYEERIRTATEALRDRGLRRIVIVPHPVLCVLAKIYTQPPDEYAILCISEEDNSLEFVSKVSAYPILSHLKSSSSSITSPVLSLRVSSTAPALLSDPKRVAGKQSQDLLKAMDMYNERLISAIDRAQKQSETHLQGVENALYKKTQAKLQKIDDFISAQKPITTGLEEVKAGLAASSDAASIQRRLDALNATLKRCQKDLQELETTTGTYADDPFGKMLPLHIMDNVQLVNDSLAIRVVNLKQGSFRGAQMQIRDEQGEEVLDVLDLRPGVQTIRLKLHRDMYTLGRLRVVFLLFDREISNVLDISFSDDPPPPQPVDEEAKSSVLDQSSEEVQLNERESGIFSQLEGVFRETANTTPFLEKFLSLIRGPSGDTLSADAIAELMLAG